MTKLAKMLSAYQKAEGVDGKTLAREIGIAESGLSRLKQGKITDVPGFLKLLAWMVSRG